MARFLPLVASVAVRVTVKVEGDGYRIVNLVFESRSGLWATANLYAPLTARPPSVGDLKNNGEEGTSDASMLWLEKQISPEVKDDMSKTTMIGLTIALFLSTTALAGQPKANVWQPFGDGVFPLPDKGYPNLTGPSFLWLGERDMGLIAPILTEGEGRTSPGYRKLTLSEPKWTFVPGKTTKEVTPDMWDSPRSYVHLPGLKKVLVLKQEWSYSPKRKPVSSWLLDPVDASWEPLFDSLSMSDRSSDYHPFACRDGLRLPIWGTLCYDALNKEAVSFGGGGVWGRVGKEKEKVVAGDWVFDEQAKRIRRLSPGDKAPALARKWFPGHAGTWTFAETEKSWQPIDQPLGQQPSGRILPGMAYDAAAQKIVLFGGYDLAR